MKVNDKDCNFTSTFKAKVTLSKKEWLEKEQEITTNVEKKVAGGSPKKTYDTFDDLKLAEPEGDQAPVDGYDGTRLVKTNTDKLAHWYYFDNITKTWEDGGIYIAGDLDQYAKVDGSYEELEAGSAKTISSRPVIDENSYISRETYNGAEFDEGIAKIQSIKGNTEKSTNLILLADQPEQSFGTLKYKVENGIIILNGTLDSTTGIGFDLLKPITSSKYTFYKEGTWQSSINCRLENVEHPPIKSGTLYEGHNSVVCENLEGSHIVLGLQPGTYENVKIKLCCVDGTPDVLPPFSQGYEGLRSATPTKLISKDAEGTKTSEIEIAPEIQALEGYGLGVNDVRNEVDLVNKKFIRRVYGSITINGSETWTGGNGNRYLGQNILDKIPSSDTRQINQISTWIDKNSTDTYKKINGLSINELNGNGNVYIYIEQYANDIEAFKQWLHDNPITFVYILETPEIIDLPVVQDDKFVAYNGGTEIWEGTQVPVATKTAYASALVKKLVALPTRPEYDEYQTQQDNRIKALEDRLAQLEARVQALEPAPTNEGEI